MLGMLGSTGEAVLDILMSAAEKEGELFNSVRNKANYFSKLSGGAIGILGILPSAICIAIALRYEALPTFIRVTLLTMALIMIVGFPLIFVRLLVCFNRQKRYEAPTVNNSNSP